MRFLIIALTVLFFLGCSDNESKREEYNRKYAYVIAKKWRYDGDAILNETKDLNLTDREMDLVKGAVLRMEEGIFEFKEDGNVFLAVNNGGIPGTWKLSPDCSQMDLFLIGGSKVPETVDSIGENYIKLGFDKKKGRLFPKILVPAN